MNAVARRFPTDLEPLRLGIPEAAWRRLRLHLGRALATGEALDVALAYGVAPDELVRLLDYWLHDFEPERPRLNELPCFELSGDSRLVFAERRSSESFAVPLLLLHAYSGSLGEFRSIVPALVEPRAHGASPADAFHAVCPSLPGFGLSPAAPNARAVAESLAKLMEHLGYSRYVVHGSDLGAALALELAALDGAHVAGVHVTSLVAYPGEDPFQLFALSQHEKSQFARLCELREQLVFQLPESPLEALGFALSQLDTDALGVTQSPVWRDALLDDLSLTWTLADSAEPSQLYRDCYLAAAPVAHVPIAVHTLPLAAPSLRRFSERRQRVVEWTDSPHGGSRPALEMPHALVEALRAFAGHLR